MPADEPANEKPTLGQRIDAMLGPLDQDAQAFREAITSGRAQMAQMQARIDQAEGALAGIEEKMIRVLKTLAAEEPMLALAMGAGDELPPEFAAPVAAPVIPNETTAFAPSVPAHTQPELPTPPPAAPAEPAPAQADAQLSGEALDAQSPEVVTLEKAVMPGAGEDVEPFVMPTPEEDAAAVDEILGLLDAEPGLTSFDASATPGSPLADAAAQADAVARSLDGVGE